MKAILVFGAVGALLYLGKRAKRWGRPVPSPATLVLGPSELLWRGFVKSEGQSMAREAELRLPLHELTVPEAPPVQLVSQDSRSCLILQGTEGQLRLPFLGCTKRQAEKLQAYLNDAIHEAAQRQGKGTREVPHALHTAQAKARDTEPS